MQEPGVSCSYVAFLLPDHICQNFHQAVGDRSKAIFLAIMGA